MALGMQATELGSSQRKMEMTMAECISVSPHRQKMDIPSRLFPAHLSLYFNLLLISFVSALGSGSQAANSWVIDPKRLLFEKLESFLDIFALLALTSDICSLLKEPQSWGFCFCPWPPVLEFCHCHYQEVSSTSTVILCGFVQHIHALSIMLCSVVGELWGKEKINLASRK